MAAVGPRRAPFSALLVLSARLALASAALVVDPLIGTGGGNGLGSFGAANLNPGATAPFALLRLGPDTTFVRAADGAVLWVANDHIAGYSYNDTHVLAFSHTHVQGGGCNDLGNFGAALSASADVGALVSGAGAAGDAPYKTRFAHGAGAELARPGYYALALPDVGDGALAELVAAGARSGVHRYACPTPQCTLLLDVCHGAHAGGCPAANASFAPAGADGAIVISASVLDHGYFAQQGGGVWVHAAARLEVAVAAGASVAALIEAAAAKLRLDAPLYALFLTRSAGFARAPPLDATQTLEEALAAGALAPRAKLLATVAAEVTVDEVEEIIRYRRAADDAEMEQPVVSAADFDSFRADKTIWAVRRTEVGVDKKLREVTRLQDARKVLATPGLHLLVRDKYDFLPDDVLNQQRESKNAATSFEQLANKAVASDAGAVDEVEEIIRYRRAADDAEMEQPVVSAADFDNFRRDKTIWAVRRSDAGVDKKLRQVTRLQDARKVLLTPGLHLLVRDKFLSLTDEVPILQRESKNAATSFEELANKAVASDAGLRARYGALTPFNAGEGVVFVDKRTGKDFASYDGLFLSSSALVFNESKARLTEAAVAVARAAHASLSAVVADPARFSSRPVDAMTVLLSIAGQRRAIVPLLSSTTCDAKTAAACAAARVHVLVRTGEGFACALADADFVA